MICFLSSIGSIYPQIVITDFLNSFIGFKNAIILHSIDSEAKIYNQENFQ